MNVVAMFVLGFLIGWLAEWAVDWLSCPMDAWAGPQKAHCTVRFILWNQMSRAGLQPPRYQPVTLPR
ncbi:MAG TPA: hypothetical protein VFY83_02015 [Anaerolineales bacterium]|nr:hypothetical protein [Anaerolineales bacterium]